jgi:hypothetical protein
MKELDLLKDWQRTKILLSIRNRNLQDDSQKIIIYCEMDFNHQYYGGFVVDLFNMILMQTIILKTSITMDSLLI